MKKSSKKARSQQNSSGTGVALLICFFIAAIGVAVAVRQLVLERRYLSTIPIAASPAPTTTLAGNFESKLADRTINLELKADRSASINQDHTNNKLDFKENGSWSGDTNGTIIISIGDKTTYAFSAQNNILTLLNPDIKIWGSNKVSFFKK